MAINQRWPVPPGACAEIMERLYDLAINEPPVIAIKAATAFQTGVRMNQADEHKAAEHKRPHVHNLTQIAAMDPEMIYRMLEHKQAAQSDVIEGIKTPQFGQDVVIEPGNDEDPQVD